MEKMYIHLVSENDMPDNIEKSIDNKIKKLEIEMKLRGFSANTIKSYLLYNEKFMEYIKKSPEDVTEDDIKEFMAQTDKVWIGTCRNLVVKLKDETYHVASFKFK